MKKIIASFAVLLALGFNACSTPNQTLGAQIAVMLATDQVVKNRPDRAAKAVAIADEVIALSKGDTATTVDMLIGLVRAKIDWSKLTPTEQTAVNLLLATIKTELEQRIQIGQIPADQLWRVALVAEWIKLAAAPYLTPA